MINNSSTDSISNPNPYHIFNYIRAENGGKGYWHGWDYINPEELRKINDKLKKDAIGEDSEDDGEDSEDDDIEEEEKEEENEEDEGVGWCCHI